MIASGIPAECRGTVLAPDAPRCYPADVAHAAPTDPGPEGRYTSERYFALIADGILEPEDRVELLEGVTIARRGERIILAPLPETSVAVDDLLPRR